MIHVVLYRPEKPLNTGNIMRTCMAVKAKLHIIGPITFSLAEKDLKRAGLDYIETLDYDYYENIEEFNKKHSNINIFYISRYGDKVYSNEDFSDVVQDIYVMFGRESTGIPHDILRENMDRVLRLPMVPNARSLNLSNCVAIVVYEILRQQKFNDLSTSEAIKGEDFLSKELNKS
ncbi:MAG: tRNA (cytidine(34)-2'-O)-methyltransferase [Bacilli bacterium]|nr:tRNA (cytidine(34)-2'-O)-methyltransferase [Bacilli bacterium]MBO4682570.1 tRNA (cytidine(34)-2'-O)-methyltransferase [Bacilli bacterium]